MMGALVSSEEAYRDKRFVALITAKLLLAVDLVHVLFEFLEGFSAYFADFLLLQVDSS